MCLKEILIIEYEIILYNLCNIIIKVLFVI